MATEKQMDDKSPKSIRKTPPRSQTSSAPDGLPLTPDELLKRDNTSASEPVPPELARRFATRQLIVSGLNEPIKTEKVEIEYGKDVSAFQWRLPAHAIIGLSGRTATRLPSPSPEKKSAALASTAEPYRPKWADQIYHLKRTVVQPWARGPISRPGYTGEVYYGVYPPDDRAVYYPSGYPWQCIGKIYVWNDASATWPAWSGSGVLIGPRLVLTAGHVVPWDANTWMMRFVPAYYDGTSILGSGVESYVSDARGWDVSYRSRLPNAYDMAVLRLYDPLGDWLGYFGSKPYWKGYTEMRYWNITGYPGAIAGAERPSYQPGIEVIDAKPNGDALEIEHHGDATNGDSGAPFWATWSDGFPYAIGTVSGGEASSTEDNNVVAGGNAINDLIRWGRTNWP